MGKKLLYSHFFGGEALYSHFPGGGGVGTGENAQYNTGSNTFSCMVLLYYETGEIIILYNVSLL